MQHIRCFAIIFLLVFPFVFLPVLAHEEGSSEGAPGADSARPSENSLDKGDSAPPFELTDQNGERIALSDFNGRPRFVTFVYTHCEDVCPLILQNRRRLEADMTPVIGDGIVFIGITVDPENDSSAVLKAFIQKIGVETRDLHLLTGSVEAVEAVLLAYNVGLVKEGEFGRVVGHSGLGYAIDAAGIIRDIYNFSS
ncbi:MAG: SCO family protein [Nitrospiria bacterium]